MVVGTRWNGDDKLQTTMNISNRLVELARKLAVGVEGIKIVFINNNYNTFCNEHTMNSFISSIRNQCMFYNWCGAPNMTWSPCDTFPDCIIAHSIAPYFTQYQASRRYNSISLY